MSGALRTQRWVFDKMVRIGSWCTGKGWLPRVLRAYVEKLWALLADCKNRILACGAGQGVEGLCSEAVGSMRRLQQSDLGVLAKAGWPGC